MKKIISLILFLAIYTGIYSAERLSLSVDNRIINSGVYFADIMVNVPSSDNKWLAAASTIVLKFNSSGLNLNNLDGVNVQNLDSELSSSGYSCTQTDFGTGTLAINLFTTNPNVNKNGSFRLCTVRWNISSSTQYDSLKYDTDQCEIFNGSSLMLDYNCNTPSCYKVVNPSPQQLQVNSPRMTFSIKNRNKSGNTYFADLYCDVASSSNKWLVAASTIVLEYNHNALNLTNLDGVSVQNLDSELSSAGYSATQTDFGSGYIAINLFTTNPNVQKSGEFRICTIRWNITDGSKNDSIKFDGDISEIFNGTNQQLDYNCNTPSCFKVENPNPQIIGGTTSLATVNTTTPSNITSSSASSGGNVTNDGGASVTARGVCWSTTQNPTISNSKTTDGTGTGSFTSSITGLNSNTKYYVRAYATNSVGTAYGNQDSLTTGQGATIPTVSTTSISNVTQNSASSGGNVTNDGGANVTARGVCWATTQNPTISNSKTTDGSGTGTFTSSITGLTANTTYFVRAYATNSVGTGYGDQKSFKTDSSGIIDVPSSWDFTELTGNNAIIVLPTDINPKIGTRNFAVGDAIGFFFTRNNQKVCGGYSKWTGNNLQITAWGDNSETAIKDGFVTDEVYTVKIWDAQLGKEYDANVTYSQGNNFYSVNGFSVLGSLSAILSVTHELSLASGWNMISTYAEPENKSMPVIWDSIKTFVTLVKNNSGAAYIPSFNINNIGNWNKYEGYQAFLTQAKTLKVTGVQLKPEDTPISLTSGWKIVSYLRNSAMSAPTALATLVSDNALTLCKNNAGAAYIPSFNINNLGSLQPGQGYQMFLSKNSTLTYPANSSGRASAGEFVTPLPKVLIPEHKLTGNNSILLVQNDSPNGDEIGIYNQKDMLIGSGIFHNGIALVTIWGDDEYTAITDGAVINEELRIKNYDAKTGRLSEIELTDLVDIISDKPISRLTYSKDGFVLSKINNLNSNSTISLNVSPNPASEYIEIEFNTPDCKASELKIYSITGKLVSDLSNNLSEVMNNKLTQNISNFTSGEYTIILTCGNERAMRKIVVVR